MKELESLVLVLLLVTGLLVFPADSALAAGDGDAAPEDNTPSAGSWGVGHAVLPSSTDWDRGLTLDFRCVNPRPSSLDWYGRTSLTFMFLRSEDGGPVHGTFVISMGFAKTWIQGRASVGIGAGLWGALENDSEGVDSWGLLPEVFVRVPLVWKISVESTYALVRESKRIVGGLDVVLAYNFWI